jgi:hypothetical protein
MTFVSDDLRAMLESAASLTDLPTAVTLKTGVVVEALPGVATLNDQVLGAGGEISGDERTLRFVAEDVPGIRAGDPLGWDSKSWKVKHVQRMANGSFAKTFLQEVP